VSHRAISSNRLEAFSDGVFAILITIMVFEIHTPTGYKFSDLAPLRPVLLSYLLSFVYLIIYWNNHHHLLNTVEKPSSWTMWANANLLFWLSLIPFTTSWLLHHIVAWYEWWGKGPRGSLRNFALHAGSGVLPFTARNYRQSRG